MSAELPGMCLFNFFKKKKIARALRVTADEGADMQAQHCSRGTPAPPPNNQGVQNEPCVARKLVKERTVNWQMQTIISCFAVDNSRPWKSGLSQQRQTESTINSLAHLPGRKIQ